MDRTSIGGGLLLQMGLELELRIGAGLWLL